MGEYAHIHLNIKKERKILSNWNSNKEILVVYFYNNSNQDLLHTSWPCSCMAHGKESTCQYERGKRCGFDPWVGKIPWKKKWQPSLVFLPGKSMDTGAWWAIAHGVTESTQLSTRASSLWTPVTGLYYVYKGSTHIISIITTKGRKYYDSFFL